ncbi:eCIS core domain-containing protein [Propionibacteriaceae bacterium Y2011]
MRSRAGLLQPPALTDHDVDTPSDAPVSTLRRTVAVPNVGNRATAALLRRASDRAAARPDLTTAPGLTVTEPADAVEVQAGAAADQFTALGTGGGGTGGGGVGAGAVPAAAGLPRAAVPVPTPPVPPIVGAALVGGQPLSPEHRAPVESALGADLSAMQVHSGAAASDAAASLGARAFTVGSSVVLGAGESPADTELMVHEATHVLQGGGGLARWAVGSSAAVEAGTAVMREEDDSLIPDWLMDGIRSSVRSLPGYGVASIVVGEDLLTGAALPGSVTDQIGQVLAEGPFGAGAALVLQTCEVLGDVVTLIRNAMVAHNLTLARVGQDLASAWDEIRVVDGIDANVAIVARYIRGFVADIVAAIGDIVEAVITLVRNAVVDLVEPLLTSSSVGPWWDLFCKVIHHDPLRGQDVEASTLEIMTQFLELAGQQDALARMTENGTLQQTADWVDTQLATFGHLLGAATLLFTDAWDAISPENLASLPETLPGLADRAVSLAGQIMSFVGGLISKVVELIKDALLERLSAHAHGTRGFRLLTVVLGTDPFTGAAVPRTAEALIGGFIALLPGGEATYEQLAESGVIADAGGRIESAMTELGISMSMITGLFTAIWDGLSLADLVNPIGCFIRVVEQFGEPLGRLVSFVATVIQVVIELILKLMNFPGDLIGGIISGVAQAVDMIVADPVGFLLNTIAALKAGFAGFFDNIASHVISGLAAWLFRGLDSLGIQLPGELTGEAILGLVADVLGLSVDVLWERLALQLGEERVAAIRGALDRLTGAWAFISDVQERGFAAIWDFVAGQLGNLWESILSAAEDWIVTTIIERAVAKVLSMLDPTGVMAVINSAIAFFNAVQSVIEYVTEILQIVQRYVDTIVAIAQGNLAPAAEQLEGGLASAIPVALGFLANQVGLGNVPEKIVEIIGLLREQVLAAIDWVITQALRVGRAALDALRLGDPATPEPTSLADDAGPWTPDRVREAAAQEVVAGVPAEPTHSSMAALVQQVMTRHREHGLHGIELVPDPDLPGEFTIMVSASPARDAGRFRVNMHMRLSELKLSHGTTLTAHLNGVLLGTATAGALEVEQSNERAHAEQALANDVSGRVFHLRADGTLRRNDANHLVIRITRSPCAECTVRLRRLAEQLRQAIGDAGTVEMTVEVASLYQAGGSETRAQAVFDLMTLREHGITVQAWDILAHAREVFGPDVDVEALRGRVADLEPRLTQARALLEVVSVTA